MTELTGTAEASFSAHHIVKDHPRCGRNHGHRWGVAVTIKAGQEPTTGELHGLAELAEAVEQIARELDRESLNEMLPGSPPTAAGLAYAVHERLTMHFRSITMVEVSMDGIKVTLHAS